VRSRNRKRKSDLRFYITYLAVGIIAGFVLMNVRHIKAAVRFVASTSTSTTQSTSAPALQSVSGETEFDNVRLPVQQAKPEVRHGARPAEPEKDGANDQAKHIDVPPPPIAPPQTQPSTRPTATQPTTAPAAAAQSATQPVSAYL
jgi:hypothetical protein